MPNYQNYTTRELELRLGGLTLRSPSRCVTLEQADLKRELVKRKYVENGALRVR